MSYAKDGFPTELANKIGHIKIIQNPLIQSIIESFENQRHVATGTTPQKTGTLDMSAASEISRIVTVDGGHQAVPHALRPERQMGFIQVASLMTKLDSLDYLREHPMADPRLAQRLLGAHAHHIHAALPISGVTLPGLNLRDTIRTLIFNYIKEFGFLDVLHFFIDRKWEANPATLASMDCLNCGKSMDIPRGLNKFPCPECGFDLYVTDYIGLCHSDSEDRSTEETVSNFRSILEALCIFSLIIKYRNQNSVMRSTLFLLDGPLMLRAQLSRFVEPIRDFISDHLASGKQIFLVGIEKNGELTNFASSYASLIASNGDYFIPSVKFLVETINGHSFDANTYRNRVSYGSKAIVRIGPNHLLCMNIPTGQFLLSPTSAHLIGLRDIAIALGRVVSYAHENALIPVVMANSAASISNQPSTDILAQFMDQLLPKP
jgi:hypothetical protein